MSDVTYIGTREARERLNVSLPTLLRYVRAGKIRAILNVASGRYSIDLESLQAFADSRFVELPLNRNADRVE